MANPERMYFLTHEDTQKIIDACPDAEWRLIVALARYGGLRCPSELARVDVGRRGLGAGPVPGQGPEDGPPRRRGPRWVPLFPELRPHLEAAFELAEPGTVYVVNAYRDATTPTCGPTFERIIYRAGLLPWAKPFQNMRASRETELAAAFPLHVVTAWIGNSARVAAAHYFKSRMPTSTGPPTDRQALRNRRKRRRQTTHRRAQKPTQTGADGNGREGTNGDKWH